VIAEVRLWGRTIGAVSMEDGRDYATFQFTPEFVTSGIQISPVTMPLSRQNYEFPDLPRRTFHGLPGMLATPCQTVSATRSLTHGSPRKAAAPAASVRLSDSVTREAKEWERLSTPQCSDRSQGAPQKSTWMPWSNSRLRCSRITETSEDILPGHLVARPSQTF
jgi:hypothetical protein